VNGYLKDWHFDYGAHVKKGTCWKRSGRRFEAANIESWRHEDTAKDEQIRAMISLLTVCN